MGDLHLIQADMGFVPAFQDALDGAIYRSKNKAGMYVSFHDLNGLPPHLVVERDRAGNVLQVRNTIVAGFLKEDCFYTHDEALDITHTEQSACPMDATG